VLELERELSRSPAKWAIIVRPGIRWCAFLMSHRLADAHEVQRLGLNERQPMLEDFLATVGEHLHDRAFLAAPPDKG